MKGLWKMVYSVGLTGNIASGKSTVAKLFMNLGVHVISADRIARQLTEKEKPDYQRIVSHFGSSILDVNKELDRRALREIVFNHPNERLWLEKLLHPSIRTKIQEEVSICTAPYCLVEIPLLTRKLDYPFLNRILVVTAPLEIQINRVTTRDNCSKAHALAILSTQPAIEDRLELADDVLSNDKDLSALEYQVHKLHQSYLKNSLNL